MLTRTLATVTLLLSLAGATDATPSVAAYRDGGRAARRAQLVDDTEGCREPAPARAPVAAAACADGGRP